jgi:flagellar biosynthesis protein FlhF
MQIKTYKAASMKEVLSQIKTEMGPNAVIVSTRQVKDNTYGLMTKPVVEVTAAVDYDELKSPQNKPATAEVPAVPTEVAHADINAVGAELSELKGMMKVLLKVSGVENNHSDPLRASLLERGIRENLVDLMLSKLGEKATSQSVKELLTKVVRTAPELSKQIQMFVGTTGVGKTTTIAKLAARAVLNEGLSVALVTLDTYRIGAVEQGRIYAKILGTPFVSVTSPDEFRRALLQFRNRDLVLVDTVGRSASSNEHVTELSKYCEGVPMNKLLLMPVATRDKEMEQITRTFAPLGIDRMIFTKADEAITAGTVLSHNLLYRTPIAYITNGQRVPEDIVPAGPEKIIAMCLGDMQ